MRLTKVPSILRTARALGPLNVARVAAYRLGLRSGLHPVLWLDAPPPAGPFFAAPERRLPEGAVPRESWAGGDALLFGRVHPRLGDPPDWHADPFAPGHRIRDDLPWWRIPDFASGVGDIKALWELSRFDWVVAMAGRAAAGETGEIDRLNRWLADWVAANPPYRGANWKCGQEASIRVLHLALAAMLMAAEARPLAGLAELVRLHLARIAPTMGYAIGQANNHGTSEAAALFVGGSLLAGLGERRAAGWAKTGRRRLEERARALIEPDGTFSQYSVTYQRLMLDTYCVAEAWRRRLSLPGFSQDCRDRLAAAAGWLWQVTDAGHGDSPNLGAHDGSRIAALTDGNRDLRPTVQLAHALFRDEVAIAAEGPWDQPLAWLGMARPKRVAPARASQSFDDGGLHVLRRGRAVAYLRYPRFRFRPSQADALHCDLWVDGLNLVRDAGSCGYAAPEGIAFAGTAAHSTVEFDGRDQMPRLGRFLFGDWLRAHGVETVREDKGAVTAAAAYRDAWGACHARRLVLGDGRLVCEDDVSGFREQAVLRWRLCPGDWRLDGATARLDGMSVSVDAPDARVALTEGVESRHYLERTPLPVLEIAITRPGWLVTEISF